MISTIVSGSRKYDCAHRNSENHFSNGKHDRSAKISAMQIIEALEETKRGLYSGQWVILLQMAISILMSSFEVFLYNSKINIYLFLLEAL